MTNSAIQSQPLEVDPVVVPGGIRNRIVNGQFDIWQRGSVLVQTNANVLEYGPDRWKSRIQTGPIVGVATGTTQRIEFDPGQTEVPGNPTYYMQRTTDIVGGGVEDNSLIVNPIEDVRTFEGQRVTLSFWSKGSAPGEVEVGMGQTFFQGPPVGSPPVDVGSFRIQLGTNWKKYVLFFDVPSISGKVIGGPGQGGQFLSIRFVNIAGANRTTIGGPFAYTDDWCIANVQLDEGEVADPDFEVRPVGLELRFAQRYFEVNNRSESNFATKGIPAGTQTNEFWVNFKVTKRDFPVLDFNFGLSPPNAGPTFTNVLSATITLIQRDGFRIGYDPVNQADASITSRQADDITLGTWSADADF